MPLFSSRGPLPFWILILLLITQWSPLVNASAHGRESITWLKTNMPPFFIAHGEHKNQGYGDVVTEILKQNLPQYDHQDLYTNIIKHFSLFQRDGRYCVVGLYKTPEREKFLRFSYPTFMTLPPVLIMKKDRWQKLLHQQAVQLETIFQHQDFILGFSRDRSYGNPIDQVIGKHPDRSNLVHFSGQELTDNFFKMLMLDRVDGLLGLPEEAMYHAHRLGLEHEIITVEILENSQDTEGWLCYAGCPDTAWGRKAIKEINKVLLEKRPTSQYRNAYEHWLHAENKPRFRALYQEVFLQTGRK